MLAVYEELSATLLGKCSQSPESNVRVQWGLGSLLTCVSSRCRVFVGV